jgi:hypothetical protein
MKQLLVIINGQEVGTASQFEWDMPWMSGVFQPLPSFEQFRNDFEAVHQAYASQNYPLVNSLTLKLSYLRIALVDEQGREQFSTHPAHPGSTAINSVGILAGRIAWRQG